MFLRKQEGIKHLSFSVNRRKLGREQAEMRPHGNPNMYILNAKQDNASRTPREPETRNEIIISIIVYVYIFLNSVEYRKRGKAKLKLGGWCVLTSKHIRCIIH